MFLYSTCTQVNKVHTLPSSHVPLHLSSNTPCTRAPMLQFPVTNVVLCLKLIALQHPKTSANEVHTLPCSPALFSNLQSHMKLNARMHYYHTNDDYSNRRASCNSNCKRRMQALAWYHADCQIGNRIFHPPAIIFLKKPGANC